MSYTDHCHTTAAERNAYKGLKRLSAGAGFELPDHIGESSR